MDTPQPPNTYTQPPYYNPLVGGDSLDFKRYISLFISNWYWFAIAMLIAIGIAYAKNRYSEEIYTVSSTMLIKDNEIGGGNSDLANIFPGTNAFKSEQNLKNEIGILKSFRLNYRVIQELPDFHVVYIGVGRRGIVESRMYKNIPFKVVYDSLEKQRIGLPVTIKILSSDNYKLEINGDADFNKTLSFGERFTEMGFDFTIFSNSGVSSFNPDASNRYYFYFANPVALANQYRGKLSISPIEEEATLVTLSVSGSVPEQEADYINKLMEVYLQQGLEVKNETAEKTIEFIDGQIGSISDSLKKVENSLENFRLSNRLIDLSQEGTNIQSRLESYENDRSTLFLQMKYYEYLKDYIVSKNETGDIVSPGAMGVSNGSLERMVEELANLQQQKNKLKVNISEDLPAVTVIDNSINDVKALIAENINSSMKSTDNAIKDTDRRISMVEAELNKLPGTERRFINIQRKFDLNNTVYNYLLEKRAEAGIAKASTVSDNRIIDYAESFNSSRIGPKTRQNYVMALMIGLIIPAIMILLIDYLNNKIIDKKDIEKGTGAPIMGFISHNNLKTEIPVAERPGSTLAESFRSLRTNLKYFTKETQNPVISVSSTISAEGKTFISANLAAIIASNGKKVLLVGLDLRKPRIHKIFGISNDTGISNYLIGQDKFEKIIFKTEVENLWYAPSGPVPPNPAELIDSQEMKEFILKAIKQFDYVIIDTPPVALVTDALLVSPLTDFYIFVVRQRYTSKNTLALIDELHRNENIKSIGIVMNDISLTGYYGYGLRYGYSVGYGYSYGYNYYGEYHNSRYGYTDKEKGYYSDEEN
ncbi:MAG: polysaccharide biosynthesis tyrosine autokinase [Bacteroidales bacterium]|nr:polysaccharide biosynthesis tyrosine autokinase [Bacteroidales bacterium]